MSTKKNDPANYRKMSEPFSSVEEANNALVSFYDAVEEARNKFKIMDVHIIVKMNLMQNDQEKPVMVSAHYGNSLEGLPMCAWGFASERNDLNAALRKITAEEVE